MEKHPAWTKERDIELVRLMMKGMTQEGIAEEFGIPVTTIAGRIHTLGLTLRDARQAKRDGISMLDYLARSPKYAPTEPMQIPLPLKPSFAFGSFIYIPDEFSNDPAYLLHAADKLEESARILRDQAELLNRKGEAA